LHAVAGVAPAAGAMSLGGVLLPGAAGRSQPASAETSAALTTTELGGLVLVQGAGCNVLAMPGPEGALMVDGGAAGHADVLLRAVFAATGNDSIHTLINTHWHPEQTGANEAVGRAGGVILAHEKTQMYLANAIRAGDSRRDPLPKAARPNMTTRAGGTLPFAGRSIDYGYL